MSKTMKDLLEWVGNHGCLAIIILLILCSWTPIAIVKNRKCKKCGCRDPKETK